MKYTEFDVAGKEHSDRLADLLRAADVRFKQTPVNDPARPSVYIITVHPQDIGRADEVHSEDRRRQSEAFVRTLRFVRRAYSDKDMLLTREPNEAGYYASCVYHGEPFDRTRYRIVRGGWDHEHCYLCWAKVLPGEEWWATHPPNFEDEIGLCLECYARLFATGGQPGANVTRWVRWFDGDALVGEVELRGVELAFLQRLVGAPADDLMYDCWPISPERLVDLARFGPVPAASSQFTYFLEADAATLE